MIALKPALGFADRPGLAIPSGLSSHEPEVALRRRWTRTPRDPVTAGSSHLERVPNTTRAHAEPGRGSQLNLEGPRGLLWTLVASSPKREKYLRTFLSKVCTGRRTRYRRQRSEHPRNPHHRDQNWSTQISVDAELSITDCLRHVTAPLCVVSRRRRVHRVCTRMFPAVEGRAASFSTPRERSVPSAATTTIVPSAAAATSTASTAAAAYPPPPPPYPPPPPP